MTPVFPRGNPHQFERLNGEIRIWMIDWSRNMGTDCASQPILRRHSVMQSMLWQ